MERVGDPWQVRVENDAGRVHGAGLLVTGEHVLTCAHVVEEAGRGGREVLVRVREHAERAHAITVLEEFLLAATYDQRGDIAVLRLDPPVPGAPRARLRRTWRADDVVRVFGYPSHVDNGQLVRARIVCPDFNGERVQLDAVCEQRVVPGFSGAPVLTADGEVVGIVASVRGTLADSSWMIPVPVLGRAAARILDPCLTGGRSVEPTFTRRPPGPAVRALDGPVGRALARRLAEWLDSRGPGGVCAVGGGALLPLVGRLTASPDGPAAARAPGPGVDAAVDATGRTGAQVADQLRAALGLPPGADLTGQLMELGTPLVLVVNAVDAAADPAELHATLLSHLVRWAPGIGVRLLLGCAGEPPRRLSAVVAGCPPSGPAPPAPYPAVPEADFPARLAALTARCAEVAAAERAARERLDHVSVRVLGAPPRRTASAAALGVRLAVLTDLAVAAGPAATPGSPGSPDAAGADAAVRAWLPGELAACERMAEHALTRATGTREQCDALLARRDELRDLLAAHHALADAHHLLEALEEPYAVAFDRLRTGPCNLRLAAAEVAAYGAAVRAATEGRAP